MRCTQLIPEVKEKSLATIKSRYVEDITNVFQTDFVKQKIVDYNIKHFNVTNVYQRSHNRQKARQNIKKTSKLHLSVINFIKSFGVNIEINKIIIDNNKEVDIYIP